MNMSHFFSRVVTLVAVLLTVPALAADPLYLRELERQTKAEQSRSMRKALGARDFAAPDVVEVEAYRFDLNVEPAAATLSGLVAIELTARTTLSRVTLDSVGLAISQARFVDEAGAESEVRFEKTAAAVAIDLPVTVAAGRRFTLVLSYSAQGDRKDGNALEHDSGLFFVNGDASSEDATPTVYTSVQPQLARTWFPCLDHPSYKANRTSMRVTVPSGWVAVSNGALKNAVSSPDQRKTTFEWEEGFPIPTYLISLAIAPYLVIDERAGNVPVQYFVPKKLEKKARHDFGRTPEMLEYFSSLWSPYPFEKYAMATVPYYGGAMEHTTATTMSDAHVTGDRESEETVAHELAHHWWGNIVTAADWDDLWLNEGFATYGETLFDEKFKGSDFGLEAMLWNQDSYFEFDPDGKAAVVDPSLVADDKFTPAAYEKGAWVLHMLRAKLGDQAFFKASNDYLRRYAFKNATTAAMKEVFEESSGVALDEFFDHWVFGHGYPKLEARWSYDATSKALTVSIDQKQAKPFVFPLEALVATKDKKGRRHFVPVRFEVTQKKQVFVQSLAGGLGEVVGLSLDPGLKLLKKAKVKRSAKEIQFWLTETEREHWVSRIHVLESLLDERATTLGLAVARVAAEEVPAVRAELFAFIGETLALSKKEPLAYDRSALIAAFKAGLADESLDVREAAASAAAHEQAIAAELGEELLARFTGEHGIRARAAMAKALGRARHALAFETFLGELQRSSESSGHRKLLSAILEALGELGDPRAAAILTDHATRPNPYLRPVALESLGKLAMPETFKFISDVLTNLKRSSAMRIAAAKALGHFGGIPAARLLAAQLEIEKDEAVKAAIKASLDRLGGKPELDDLLLRGSPVFLQW